MSTVAYVEEDALEIEPHNNMQRYLAAKLFGLKMMRSKGMNDQYRVFFGFQKEPFAQDLRIEEMMKGPAIIGVRNALSMQ